MRRASTLLIAALAAGFALAQQPPAGRGPPPGGMPPPPGAAGNFGPGQRPPPPPPPPPQIIYEQAPPASANNEAGTPADTGNAGATAATTPATAPAPPQEALPQPVAPFPQLEKPDATPPLELGKGAAGATQDAVAARGEGTTVAVLPSMPQALPRWLWLLAAAFVLSFLGWRAATKRSRALAAEAERLARDQRQLKSAHVQLKSQSEQLRQMATNDPLTGALNRQGFAGELRTVLEHLARFRRPLNLMLIDMDNFKQINDRLGHLVGDESLKLVVGIARQHLDSEDLLGRFGGDEFMVACADQPLEQTAALAESIRAAVVRAAAQHDPPLTGLSLSIGIAQANEQLGYRSETLFHRADTALYAAKNGGRNRVVLADESLPPPPVLEAATRHLA
jgi:diguanylate cyclase (GGDEF)-like protein